MHMQKLNMTKVVLLIIIAILPRFGLASQTIAHNHSIFPTERTGRQ